MKTIPVRFLCALLFAATSSSFAQTAPAAKPLPVILDTDIGDDIDDTWALGFLLRSPELDVKLVVGDYGRPQYRAKLLAKFLQTVGRSDIPVGLGLDVKPTGEGNQAAWVKDYDLAKYPGKVFTNGVQAMIDTIMNSQEPVAIIAIGPMPNIGEALKREPRIAEHARIVGMDGSVHMGYGGKKDLSAEWNVKAAVKPCQDAFTAPWEITITPLDTCGLVNLGGELYAQVRDSKDPIAATIIENYRLWSTHGKAENKAADSHSSTLFDTVAVYLAFTHDLCTMERLGIRVTDDGFTRIDDAAKKIDCATAWKDLEAYKKLLVARLTAAPK
jgi:inosine-uridine nucleoside N-ribohydrolase